MPIYITKSRVDWGWSDRSEQERSVIRTYQPQLDEGPHGIESFSALLGKASAELPAIDVKALIEEETRSRTLLLAKAGVVKPIHIKDATQRGPWKQLPWLELDYLSTVNCGPSADKVRAALSEVTASEAEIEGDDDEVEVPLEYVSLDALRATMSLVAKVMNGDPEEFVANVGDDRYLVSLRPGFTNVQPLIPWPSSDSDEHEKLVRQLLAASKSDLFPVAGSVRERIAASGDTKMAQSLYFPEPMLKELQVEGTRTDRSLSYLVQYAWKQAREQIKNLPDRKAAALLQRTFSDSTKCKQTLYFPGAMLAEIEGEATRFESSASWLVQLACSIAKPALATLPPAETET